MNDAQLGNTPNAGRKVSSRCLSPGIAKWDRASEAKGTLLLHSPVIQRFSITYALLMHRWITCQNSGKPGKTQAKVGARWYQPGSKTGKRRANMAMLSE
jgi:hypothetical protein